jgi:NCS1 family nucleobase:cation symporter-1
MGVEVSVGVQKSFYFAFITTGVAAGLTYYLLCRLFPPANYTMQKGLKFKEWSQGEVEVFAAGSLERPVASYEVSPPILSRADSAEDEKKIDGGASVNVLTV